MSETKQMLEVLDYNMNRYIELMDPKKVSVSNAERAREQKQMWSNLTTIFRLEGNVFIAGFSRFLEHVHANRNTVFSERFMFREFQNVELETDTIRSFRNVMVLAMHTANPNLRMQALRMMDLTKYTENLPPGWGPKIEAFYAL